MLNELTNWLEMNRIKGEIWGLEKMQAAGSLSLNQMKYLAELKAKLRNLEGLAPTQGARAGEQGTSASAKAMMGSSTLIVGAIAAYFLLRGRK